MYFFQYKLRIPGPPRVPPSAKKIMVNQTDGNNTSLYCQIDGEKTQTKWYKVGFVIVVQNKNLTNSLPIKSISQ